MDIQALTSARLRMHNCVMQLCKHEYLAVSFFLVALTLLIHGKALNGSWRWDDGAHLNFAEAVSPWQYFFIPKIAQTFSGANVSPWNALFYDINLSLFGMETTGHYAHLLLVVAAGAILFYAVLRQWLAPLPAAVGAMALLLGKPTFHIAAGLMHGHYATGFAFTMLAILGWARYLRDGQKIWWIVSVLSYLLATTCKEVYVPLVLLLFFLPVGTWSQRARALLPFILVAALYTGWRYWLLGRLVGGYSQGSFDAHAAANQFLRIPHLLIGSGPESIILLTVLIALLLWANAQKYLNRFLIAATFILIFLPLLPLTAFPGINAPDRYLFVPWIAFSALLATILPRNSFTPTSLIITTLTLVTLICLHAQERQALKPNLVYWDTLYRFALSADKKRQAIFVATEFGGSDDGYKRLVLTGARSTADRLTPRAQAGRLRIVDESGRGLYRVQATGMQLFEYSDEHMQPMSSQRIAEKLPGLPRMEQPKGIPLKVDVVFASGMLNWDFGPYEGDYLIHHQPRASAPHTYTLSNKGKTPWIENHPLRFSFCRGDIADDFDACSPVLEFNFESSKTGSWQGIVLPSAVN